MIRHVVKRMLLMAVAYVVAVPVGLVAILLVYMTLSSLPGAPSYFTTISLSPLVVLAVPPVALIVAALAIILTSLPTLIVSLIGEIFALRQWWLYAAAGAAISAGAFVVASPELVGAIGGTDWIDMAIVAAGGFFAGTAFWGIAGRKAGFGRPPAIATPAA